MWSYKIVDADFVEREIGRMPIVDVRPPLMYDGGHIPTAVNVRLDVAMADDEPGEVLADMLQNLGILPHDGVIVYCRSGLSAKIACDCLSDAGYDNLYLYVGSMNDWVRDASRPIERTQVDLAMAS